jgi:acyl-CoA dehydrogenase
MIARVNDPNRTTFGKPLHEHGTILNWIANSRLEIDAARLLVLAAAHKIDTSDAKGALKEIAEAKIMVPQVSLSVIDRAVQAFGAAGVSQDTPLAEMWSQQRTLRIADGPDEVHLQQLGRNENQRGGILREKIEEQRKRAEELVGQSGVKSKSHL